MYCILFIPANYFNRVSSNIRDIKKINLDLSIFSVYGHGAWSISVTYIYDHGDARDKRYRIILQTKSLCIYVYGRSITLNKMLRGCISSWQNSPDKFCYSQTVVQREGPRVLHCDMLFGPHLCVCWFVISTRQTLNDKWEKPLQSAGS